MEFKNKYCIQLNYGSHLVSKLSKYLRYSDISNISVAQSVYGVINAKIIGLIHRVMYDLIKSI